MKTNQDMIRYIDTFSVVQRTSDGYFDGSELLRQWNSVEGNSQRKMDEFLLSKETSQFIVALIAEERNNNLGENSPKIDNQAFKKSKVKEKGKVGRPKEQVWMHPFLFIRFAMWINPRFEVKVIKFVYDEMIRYRNEAGDAYLELGAAVQKIVPKGFMPKAMKKVGEALNWVVFNQHEKMLRNKQGDESKQRDLWQLEKKVADLINEGFITNFDNLIDYLRKQYSKRNYPSLFLAS